MLDHAPEDDEIKDPTNFQTRHLTTPDVVSFPGLLCGLFPQLNTVAFAPGSLEKIKEQPRTTPDIKNRHAL